MPCCVTCSYCLSLSGLQFPLLKMTSLVRIASKSPSPSCFKYNTKQIKDKNKADFRNRHKYNQMYFCKHFETCEWVPYVSM